MSAQTLRTITIGKSRITISVEGCVDCGVAFSPAWTEDRRHEIQIGSRRDYITLRRCAGCTARRGRTVEQYEAPTALQRTRLREGSGAAGVHQATVNRFEVAR